MQDFSITRIPNNDLIGLLFTPLVSLSEYEIEVIHPEYVNGYYYTTSGQSTAQTGMQIADLDVSKYDYVLLPIVTSYTGVCSGLRQTLGSGSIVKRAAITIPDNSITTLYVLFSVSSAFKYAALSTLNDRSYPVIGFRRHRSDNVNPRSPQRPELEPIEIRERHESEPEPVPEIAEPEEETPEEVEEE